MNKELIDGAKKCLEYLKITENDNIVCLCNTEKSDITEPLLVAVNEITHNVMAIHLPGPIEFFPAFEAAIKAATVVLTPITRKFGEADLRVKLIRTVLKTGGRMGHMIDVTKEMLRPDSILFEDIPQLKKHSDLVADILTRSRKAVLTTSYGTNSYELHLDLGGWKRAAIADAVAWEPGTFINIPSGESYIVPENTNGEVLIDGSIPAIIKGKALHGPVYFKITNGMVQRGQIKSIAKGDACKMQLENIIEKLAEEARRPENENDSVYKICELGIGTNTKASAISGIAINDEKISGSVHIALGSNASFCKPGDHSYNKATIHADCIIRSPTLEIDDKPVIKNGELLPFDDLKSTFFKEDYSKSQKIDLKGKAIYELKISKQEGGLIKDKKLHREYETPFDKKISVKVGNNRTAEKAALVWESFDNSVELTKLLNKKDKYGLDEDDFLKLLSVLEEYELIKIEEKPGKWKSGS